MSSKRKVPPSDLLSLTAHRLIKRSQRRINRSHCSRPNKLPPILCLPLDILVLCVNFAIIIKGQWGTDTFVADFGILACVCRPFLQLTKSQHFVQSLYERGLYFTKPFGMLDRMLRKQMGILIQEFVLNTASGAPLWGNLCRTDDMCLWKGILMVPETSPFASADVAVTIRFGFEFPMRPPRVHFDSRVFHPNVNCNAHGKLCVPFLGDEWSPSFCLSSLLWNVISVLDMPYVPEYYADDNEAMKLYIGCPKRYHARAKELYEKTPGECTAGASNTEQKQ